MVSKIIKCWWGKLWSTITLKGFSGKKTLLFIQESRTCSCKALVVDFPVPMGAKHWLLLVISSMLCWKILHLYSSMIVWFRSFYAISIYLDKFLISSLISSHFALMFFFLPKQHGPFGRYISCPSDRKSVTNTAGCWFHSFTWCPGPWEGLYYNIVSIYKIYL